MENEFNIKYSPVHPGTDSTRVMFNSGRLDLISELHPGVTHEDGHRRFFVTDATVATLPVVLPFIEKFDDGKCNEDNILILGSGEPYKTIESVLTIIKAALEADYTRKDKFIGIGGGVICDITGFAASLFKRGAAVEFVPTTLLAMVDAAIGGKTGCDFDNYKNMIGTFFPAQSLHIFPEFIQSLSDDQYRSGLAEAFKTALLYDKKLYELFRDNSEKIKKRDKSINETLIRHCIKVKSEVVEQDLMEKDKRAFLNFGHTFGHALESLVGLGNITHGDAVAWGIGRAIMLSNNLDLCNAAYRDEVLSVLESYGWETSPFPKIVKGGGVGDRLLANMHKDKKNSGNTIKLILQKGLTETLIQEISDDKILTVLK
ncbi:MAG: 3-dehydroquinate synthase [Treponema sp.]|nr:3-dehydroquinate synthase [Treponema sp.]